MPLFLSDEEFAQCANDSMVVAQKADAFIRELYKELDTVKARADAANITAEQTCSMLEQKYVSLSAEFERAEAQSKQLQVALDQRASEVAMSNSEKHQLHLQSIGKDGEIERLTTEVAELHKSKRQLLELVEQKDLEISEKNSTIKSYLEKIVKLTETAAQKDTRVNEIEAELARLQASCEHLSREKELIERHNSWLNEEFSAKVDNYNELRKRYSDLEANLSAKLKDAERQLDECSSSLNWNKERVRDLEMRVTSLQEELHSTMDAASSNEERLSAELSTVNKLVGLYKESSAEWSKKAGELEGVIKALEMQLNQVGDDYKEKLEKETSLRKHFEEEAADLRGKLQKCEAEVENSRKGNEQSLLPLSSPSETWLSSYELNDIDGDSNKMVPKIPPGVSGTALAASLLRDGWSLAKMYSKYQEAVDALRHEQMGRKEAEAVLQRVLHELEEKAELILDERVEHDRMVEAYAMLDQRLQLSVSEQANLERTIREFKAELKKRERESILAQKEIVDLQKQVTILLKECRDIQLRCGSTVHEIGGDSTEIAAMGGNMESDTEDFISERLLTFKDINGLVEQNVQLRSLVRSLSDQINYNETEFKEKFEIELKKHTDEAANKVAAVMQRAEEQARMIEALHTSVAMYKRLYEEQHKLHSSHSRPSEPASENGRKDLALLLEGSQEATKKAQEQATERIKCLEEELAKFRSDIASLRSERDKLALEAKFSKERLDSFLKEFEHQRDQMNGVLARNVEFSRLIIDHQRKLRESSESMQAAEEHTRKLSMEVSVMKHSKEVLVNAEKRACDEVRTLTERVYRLQASLDTIQSAEEVREEARVAERRKQEEHIKQLEREWAEAKKELQDERDNVRTLTLDREQTLKNAMRQVEDMGKDLGNALRAVSAAEARAAVAEAKLSDLEKKIKSSNAKLALSSDIDGPSSISSNEVLADLQTAKDEIDKLREEAQANKDHMQQYKNIAAVNEDALKQMECAHENFKNEAEKQKKSLEDEIQSLKVKVSDLEKVSNTKSEEVAYTSAAKEEELAAALSEKSSLIEEISEKTSQLSKMEFEITSLKENLENERDRWRTAQSNYERQVVLQSETIQELTKTSQALAVLQDETSELRKLADKQKTEINELKVNWETEKSVLEKSKNVAEKKYDDLNEQNKILHERLEALHIKLAEKDRSSSGIPSGSASSELLGDAGLQNVIGYLRRSKEIAETEISLLKQEKLRLQSQLESALKAAETAKSSLDAERTNSRTLLFTEEEIKSLQLQVREINLLRESNLQLREENKHNFEECQKLRELAQQARAEAENLENLLNERQIEIEASRKEIEKQRMEKDLLEKRVHELLERCGNISVEDFDHMKNGMQRMQEQLMEKDTRIGEIKNLLSGKEEKISRLEQDLANSKVELNEREKRVHDMLQTEAKTKGELDKLKRLLISYKRRNESLSKEKEEISKENQALSKQMEDLKQGRTVADTGSEQTMKENEKDTRIKILEKHVEKLKENLKKEKEDIHNEKGRRLKNEKAITESFNLLEQDKMKFINELEKHKQALKRLSEELEKIKVAKNDLPEATAVFQLLSGSSLDDRAATYASAVENFERTANSVLVELGGGVPVETSTLDRAAAATSGLAIPPQVHTAVPSTGPGASSAPAKSTEEGGKKSTVPKPNVETRKPGRRLVRPRLVRPEEPQADTEMSEMEGPSIGEKLVPPHETEAHGAQPVVRKRTSESHNESNAEGDASADVLPPASKKSKGSDTAREGEGTTALPSESVGTPHHEESFDVAAIPQDDNEDAMDADKEDEEQEDEEEQEQEEEEEESPEEKVDVVEELEQLDSTNGAEAQKDKDVAEENVEKTNETDVDGDNESKGPDEQDNQQPTETEEGEVLPDATDLDGIETSNPAENLDAVEGQTEPVSTPAVSPLRTDDESIADQAGELGETNSPEASQDEKNEEGEIIEGTAEGSDKSKDSTEPNAVESEPVPKSTTGTDEITSTTVIDGSKQSSSNVTTVEEVKPPGDTPGVIEKSVGSTSASTTINLQERARQRAALRQAGVVTPAVSRGRGRAVLRGRVRGRGRGGRGQPPNEQS